MTEASRVQNMLNEQNAWIDKLKSQIMRLELDVVGYKVRNKQLEMALREIHEVYAGSEGIPEPMTAAEGYLLRLLTEMVGVTRKALEEKND
jgi:hypothetical protein